MSSPKVTFASQSSAVPVEAVLGDGYIQCSDKDELVGVPFVITGIKLVDNSKGQFAVIRVVTQNDDLLVFTDGGTGVYRQAVELVAAGHAESIMVSRGLRASRYTTRSGEPATTYYLAV